MKQISYQSSASPVDNLRGVVDFLCKIGGVPDGDGTTGLEVQGVVVDYFNYSNAESGEEKLGVNVVDPRNGRVLFHCIRYCGLPEDMQPVIESDFYQYQHGPDAKGNLMVVCYQEQTMELEVERIIDFAIARLVPDELGKVA